MSERLASIAEVQRFFGSGDLKKFRDEWRALTDEEKYFFKVEVGKLLPQ